MLFVIGQAPVRGEEDGVPNPIKPVRILSKKPVFLSTSPGGFPRGAGERKLGLSIENVP